jgi:uncharacterized protein YaaN involved in tellurite resistance
MDENTVPGLKLPETKAEAAPVAEAMAAATEITKNSTMPELTLEPEAAAKQLIEKAVSNLEVPEAPDAREAIAAMDTAVTAEEHAAIESFSKKIDLTNPDHVMLYGADAQKKVSSFADTILGNVKNIDSGDVGDMLTKLVGELKGFESSSQKPKGIRALFMNAKSFLATVQTRYEVVSVNVEKIAGSLEQHQIALLKDISMFDRLYDMNLVYFKELTMYILAGEMRLKEVREKDLVQLQTSAAASKDVMESQKANDLAAQCDRFEKKLYDLKLTRQISLQMAPQIRLLQNNNSLLVERIQSSLVNTLPLWKNQMVLALGLFHSQQAMKAQRAVTDMTNDLLKKNAESLKMGTIETAKEAERGIIDIETLVTTNQSLIDTMNEVVRIHTEGRQKRAEAEKTLLRLEGELKQKLLIN